MTLAYCPPGQPPIKAVNWPKLRNAGPIYEIHRYLLLMVISINNLSVSDGGASDACVCEKGFDGRYCQNGKVKLPLSVGAGSPAVVIIPVILIVIIVLVLIGLYIYWRDPFFMRR